MEIKRLVEYVRVCHKSHLLSIPDKLICLLSPNSVDRENVSATRSKVFGSSSTSEGFLVGNDFVSHVKDKESIGLFANENDIVSES